MSGDYFTEDPGNMISLPLREYLELIQASEFLNCLKAAGVDDWEGYEVAIDLYSEE